MKSFNGERRNPWECQRAYVYAFPFCFLIFTFVILYIHMNIIILYFVLCHLQIVQALSLNLLENLMHVKGAQISKFVPLPPKDLTLVLFFILFFYTYFQRLSISKQWHDLFMEACYRLFSIYIACIWFPPRLCYHSACLVYIASRWFSPRLCYLCFCGLNLFLQSYPCQGCRIFLDAIVMSRNFKQGLGKHSRCHCFA